MWSLCYGLLALFLLWLSVRIVIWQIARWVKSKFDVDIAIKSTGLFSAKEVTIRVNQLQTIEIDKVALQLNILKTDASHLVSLHFGEVRVRAEMKATNTQFSSASSNVLPPSDASIMRHRRTSSFAKRRDTLVKCVETFFKYVSLHVDVLNIMLLNAFVPDSLLHVNIQNIHLASEKPVISHEPNDKTALTGNLSIGGIEGKILKSPKEASEVTSCIAEISTSLEIVVLAKHLHPTVELTSVNIDFSKLRIEIHEGALIPGIFLPSLKTEQWNQERKQPADAATVIDQVKGTLLKTIQFLPINSVVCIRSFGLAFFGDETMGETTRGAHVCSSKILLSQFKDTTNLVPISIKDHQVEEFTVPSGYLRFQVDDVTMTDYYKHQVATMGKTVIESKLTSNSVLSTSFDFTSWHADYMHKESVEFWSIIFNKLQEAERQKSFLQQAMGHNALRDDSSNLSNTYPVINRRSRTSSAPNSTNRLSHPDILQGTENASFDNAARSDDGATFNQSNFRLTDIINKIALSVVFECTIYDASIIAILSPVLPNQFVSDEPPRLVVGLHSFMGSIDQSPHTRDFNFMSKLEHFWCKVSQDGVASSYGTTSIKEENHSSLRQDVHQWGQAFKLEHLGLHGSASVKPTAEIDKGHPGIQEISLLIDAKVAGLQLEASKCTAQALVSLLYATSPDKFGENEDAYVGFRRVYQRQITTPEEYHPSSRSLPKKDQITTKYRFSVACVELELKRVNAFILSADETNCADCLVARIDQLKAEVSGGNSGMTEDDGAGITRSVSIVGFAITTVHNPFFSAFASYEAGLNGGRTPTTRVSESIREQQTIAAQYRCMDAAYMSSKYISFDILEVSYVTSYRFVENEGDFADDKVYREYLSESGAGGIRRQLTLSLSSESDISIKWTPALHALVHYEITDFLSILSPFFKKKKVSSATPGEVTGNANIQTDVFTNDGDHNKSSNRFHKHNNISMCGDGNLKQGATPRCLELNVDITAVVARFVLTETQSIQFSLSPLSCEQSDLGTSIKFDEVSILMDDNNILTFTNTLVCLSKWNETCHRDRQSFIDLKTAENRAWEFKFASIKCHFPYQYDFAATFDQTVTTFKWVKGLYRKTSHPFRSSRLPPDLLICIGQFVFEIADWEFECHLRDNHELIKDEWAESEKRRRVLDQRMAELRRKRGELLPAKKVEELYCQLADTNINIYLIRSRKMYQGRCMPLLLQWTLTNFKVSVLSDESMHGMKNAMETIKSIDKVSPFPFKNEQGSEPEFITLWCRSICLHAARHQVRLRNYPQCLMDYSDWKIYGKFCGAEQQGLPSAKRTEYVPLPAPWGRAMVNRNMPALKFYHDLSSEVHTFNMAWGPCWDPAWSQVNLAFNSVIKTSLDPSPQLPWWDKSRILFHGRLAMSMDRANMLHLASFDPYNTTEHMLWDWKNLYMDWTPGNFLFKGDLDIHIRNATKYDDIRFLHLPRLRMELSFEWVCRNGANPNNHHAVMPCAPDKLEGDAADYDTYRHFRSQNVDLSIKLDNRTNWREHNASDCEAATDCNEEANVPKVLLYSTTLRWLSNFGYAINAVARPVCKGALFDNSAPQKLKLSRHYRNVKMSFDFPQIKVSYWSSYAQQIGIEWICETGKLAAHFRLKIVPYEGDLVRRSRGDWSVISTACDLSDTKIYLLKRREIDDLAQSPSNRSLGPERNFLLSLSKMSYRRDNVSGDAVAPDSPSPTKTSNKHSTSFNETKYKKKGQKKPSSPNKKPQNRHSIIVHDLRAMWTTENRDVGYGLYEGYNKAAVMRRNLSTKVLNKFRIGSDPNGNKVGGAHSRRQSQLTPNSESGSSGSFTQKAMDPSHMLRQLLSETDNKFVVGTEEPTTEQQQLKGIVASKLDDVVNKNWLIKFVNCQAMLKGPKTQGYIIMTAAEADFLNRDHKVTWRDGQLTTKSSWVGSLSGTQVFATVERNVTSSGQDGENVPWLSVSDIAPRGPSPGMLDISDLMGGGQAIGGVVGDGISAGLFQLQRIVSRCTCRMFYVGYEALVDSEQSDYGRLLPETPVSMEDDKTPPASSVIGGNDSLGNEKPINVLTVLQPDLEICTNTSQFTMMIDIVENLLLYVEPGMREHWEKVERMRYKLRLTSTDDAAKHRSTLASMQSRIRTRLTNMRQLERQLFTIDRELDNNPDDSVLFEECNELREKLNEEKQTLKLESEELGIIIRCFKEMLLEEKTRESSLRPLNEEQEHFNYQEDEASVVRTTEVSLGQVKWHLTDADGQLNIAQFEMRDFFYEKINRSDDSVSHGFEVAWLRLQNLLPNSLYRDVIKPHQQMGLRSYGVSGVGGRSLTVRVLCKVRPPVGGISVKEHVEVNAVPLTIQLTFQFFKRMMGFFFPDKGLGNLPDDEDISITASFDTRDGKSTTILGLPSRAKSPERSGSLLSLPIRPPPPSPSTSTSQLSTPGNHRRNRSSAKRDRSVLDAVDDVDKMKQRAAKNNSFLYIKITQVPLCVSYKGEKEKNLEDVHDFNVTIPMLEYHNMTWTWHDLAMAVKRDCKKQLVSQVIKEKLHITGRGRHNQPSGGASETEVSSATTESSKAKLLLGNTLQRADSHRKSLFRKKK